MTQTYSASQGDTVDYIAWKFYGTQSGRVVEQVMDANPGLADIGTELPPGTLVTLPDLQLETAATVVRLWD